MKSETDRLKAGVVSILSARVEVAAEKLGADASRAKPRIQDKAFNAALKRLLHPKSEFFRNLFTRAVYLSGLKPVASEFWWHENSCPSQTHLVGESNYFFRSLTMTLSIS
jgi:hypothetical protein